MPETGDPILRQALTILLQGAAADGYSVAREIIKAAAMYKKEVPESDANWLCNKIKNNRFHPFVPVPVVAMGEAPLLEWIKDQVVTRHQQRVLIFATQFDGDGNRLVQAVEEAVSYRLRGDSADLREELLGAAYSYAWERLPKYDAEKAPVKVWLENILSKYVAKMKRMGSKQHHFESTLSTVRDVPEFTTSPSVLQLATQEAVFRECGEKRRGFLTACSNDSMSFNLLLLLLRCETLESLKEFPADVSCSAAQTSTPWLKEECARMIKPAWEVTLGEAWDRIKTDMLNHPNKRIQVDRFLDSITTPDLRNKQQANTWSQAKGRAKRYFQKRLLALDPKPDIEELSELFSTIFKNNRCMKRKDAP